MNYNKIKLYGKLLHFKQGQLLSIFLTFKCNFRCDYCSLLWATGTWPECEISTVNQWKDYFNNIRFQVKEISLLGGEPTLYPGFTELTNWLLDKGYFVKVYTNLTRLTPLLRINRFRRFIIHASYHRTYDSRMFLRNYYRLRKKHRIEVYELGERTLGIKSRLNPILTKRQVKESALHISPDRKIFLTCDEMCKNY